MSASGHAAMTTHPAHDVRRKRWRRNGRIALLVALVGMLAAAAWVVLEPPSITALLALAGQGRNSTFAVPIALAIFVAGGLVVFPVNVLIAASLIVFGPVAGAVIALCGSVLNAVAVYEIGRRLRPGAATRAFGARGEALRDRLVDHGLLAMAVIRIVPIAPYSLVSLMAGIARIRRLDYILGTALGMTPGILVYAFFMERAREALMNPHPMAWLGLLGAMGLVIALALGTRAWSRRRDSAARPDHE